MATAKKAAPFNKPAPRRSQPAPEVRTIDDTFIALQHWQRDFIAFAASCITYPAHFSASDDIDLMSASCGL